MTTGEPWACRRRGGEPMGPDAEVVRLLLGGPLAEACPWPLAVRALLCDLRPRFLPKGAAGGGLSGGSVRLTDEVAR